MKNVVIIGSAHPLRGGLATYNERLALEFQQQGHEVTIYSFSLQYPSFLFPGKSQVTDAPAPAGLRIKSCINSINPLNWLKVGNEIRKRRPDLVVIKFWLPFMGPCFGTILRLIKRNKHTKVVCIVDNIIPHESRPGDKAFANYFVPPVDAFVAMSHAVLSDLKLFTDKPIVYSPHPLFDNFGAPIAREAALKKLGLDPAFRYMLFFGFIRDYKGLDWLLQAFADARFRSYPIRLLIAGEYYTDAAPYVAQIKSFGLGNDIIQRNDFIPNDQVCDYFCASDIVVQPYKDATQSGVTQIAYHFDKPMLVTRVGGLPEMIPHGKVGYVVAPQPQAIADALVDFYDNQREKEFVPQVKEEKKKYSWEIMYNVVMKLATHA